MRRREHGHGRGWLRLMMALAATTATLAAACSGGPGSVNLTPPTPASTVPTGGKLHTDGTTILTSEGKAVRLIGINIAGMDSSNDQGSDQRDD